MQRTYKYIYAPISRQSIQGSRHYCLPDGSKVPSVTTILSATKSQESIDALNNWRKRVGYAQSQTITSEAAGCGTVMHGMLEAYLLGTSKPPGTNLVQQTAYPMAQKVINEGLVHLNECWGSEVPLYYSEIYAGTTDGVGLWKNRPAIFDFKQTNRPKKREYIDDYFLQLAAYSIAHNNMHGTDIKTGVIMMCSRDCQYQEFVLEGDEFDEYANKWWDRVEMYFRKQ